MTTARTKMSAMWLRARSWVACCSLAAVALGCAQNSQNEQQEVSAPALQQVSGPAATNSSLPYLVVGDDEQLYLSWVEKGSDTAILKYARWEEQGWSDDVTIATGTDWFVNWADYPMVAANAQGGMLAHFLAKSSAGTYSYDVNIARKVGEEWTPPLIPHTDGTPTEHGFVTMLPLTNGSFQLAWLDGRNTGGGHGGHEGHQGAMTVRSAVLDLEGNLSEEYELDDRVCDCCQTTGAITANGPVIIYRDRSELEIRDMSIVRLVDGAWTTPQTVYADNWNIEGCPVNGPRADAMGNDLAVAWFSGANGVSQVKVIFSRDGGASFGQPVLIDNNGPLGRVDIEMLNKDQAMVSWLGREGETTVIRARTVNKNGTMGAILKVAESNEARGSGFPQMAYYQDHVWFAWTDLATDSGSRIMVSRLAVEGS